MSQRQPQPEHAPESGDWLSLQEASELLGVTTSTLRRWGDSGRVTMKRTLGGHRRFARESIARLVVSPPAHLTVAQSSPASQGNWNFDARDLARQEWHTRFTAGPLTDRMRGLGQRLLGLLIQYINRREEDSRFLQEARGVGETYGRESRVAQVSMHDTVEAFLFFRSAFSQLTLPLPGIAQPTDLAAAAELRSRIDQFMDAILLGVIAGHEHETQSVQR
ncbi:MAG TPA: helix-turn-helix domain-containing protein [Roseiflexaceae bacterium]|nr:helix-turn-helix domain-containing protein [Roseiflexaceae bacterium]